MFEQKTVFVIGAGCSYEYGLPVGDGLRDEIIRRLNNFTRAGRAGSSEKDTELERALDLVGRADLGEWFNVADEMALGLHHASSIDRYLHLHRDNEKIVLLGKMLIVRSILRAEQRSSLRLGDRHLQHDLIRERAKPHHHWMGRLVLLMQEAVEGPLRLADMFRNVTFVCFNYDRCIEHFFYNALKDLGALNAESAATMMKKLRVLHPYGRVGALPWQSPEDGEHVMAFGDETTDSQKLNGVTSGIKTFMERQTEDDLTLGRIKEEIGSARQVVFLGFSFLEQNMELLRPFSEPVAKSAYATVYGEPSPNIALYEQRVRQLLQGPGPALLSVTKEDQTAGNFIHHWGNHLKQEPIRGTFA